MARVGVQDVGGDGHQGAGVRQKLFFEADHEDNRKLQTLGTVQSGHDDAGLAFDFLAIVARIE